VKGALPAKTYDLEFLQRLSKPERGERARSLLDLIELRTFDLELAAFLVSQVWHGASYITGSGPGGVGKTTTMRALLSFVPAGLHLVTALPGEVSSIGGHRHCVIANELSDHPPPTYLWGDNLRAFFALGAAGHMLVGNVHADDLDELHGQIVGTNRVPEARFRAIDLLVFICLEGGNPAQGRVKDTTTRRVVNRIYYSDGSAPHRPIYDPQRGLLANAPRDREHERRCRAFLEKMLKDKERSLEGVRQRFLEWNKAE
jgi:hypothetical protein